MDGTSVFATRHQCAPHRTHGSPEPPDSASPTASRSVQPSLHTSWQRVPILYNGTPFPLRIGDLDPHLMHASLGPHKSITQTTSRFSHFCRARDRDRQTDGPCYSVWSNRPHLRGMSQGTIITRSTQTFEMPKRGTFLPLP